MIISFSGQAGSGKSTIAKKIAKKIGWQYYDMGTIRRLKAKSLGLSLAEYNKIGENNSQSDFEVDDYQKKLSETLDNFVISGRTSWYFIPSSIKVFLDVDAKVGAKRVWLELKKKNIRNEDKNLETIKNVLESHQQRRISDIKRYKKYYKIDVYSYKNYDYVLDTTNLNKKQVFNAVYKFLLTSL